MSVGGSSAAPLVEAAFRDAPVPRRLVLLAAVRSLGVVAATLLVYALLPIEPETAWLIGALATGGLLLLGIVFTRQISRISRAARPVMAAVEALCLVFGMFVALFAFVYVSLDASDPGSFTQPLNKVAGIYFSMTVLATVGFGDIAAVTDLARLVVTFQMVLDLVLIGVAVRTLGSSARRAVEARMAAGQLPGEPAGRVAEEVDDALGLPLAPDPQGSPPERSQED